MKYRLLFTGILLVLLWGCNSPSRTVENVRRQLAEFQTSPDAEKQAAVEKSLAKLDSQIEELEKKGDRTQADIFRRQAFSLRTDFQAAKMAKALNDAKNAIQGIGDAFKEAGKSFSETFKGAETNTR